MANDMSHPFALEADPKVKERNRYLNVQAWANCRIHLRVADGECDFINASPILLEDSVTRERRKYIATQVSYASYAHAEQDLTIRRVPRLVTSPISGTWYSMRVKRSV